MKFAVPLDSMLTLYHHNPCTAPKFAIYVLSQEGAQVHYRLLSVHDNPWQHPECTSECDLQEREGICNVDEINDMHHKLEHYAMLEVVGGCSYLLAQHFCSNTKVAMKNAGVKLFQIPPFIKETDKAIKNFLIGAEIADTVQHIHNAS